MTSPEELRDRTRQQILDSMGGWSGTIVAAIPPVVFVVVNALAGLRTAIVAAVTSAVLVAGYRLARRQPVQQAAMGLFSVAIAAAIAARTGQARGYFLFGIAAAFGYAAVFAVSLLVRRPLVGVLWEYLDPSPLPPEQRWHRLRELRRAYDIATAAVLAMFLARGLVQLRLFSENRTGLLAVVKIAMGLPLYLAVVAVVFWVVRRTRHRLGLRSTLPAPAVLGSAAAPDRPVSELRAPEQPVSERQVPEQPVSQRQVPEQLTEQISGQHAPGQPAPVEPTPVEPTPVEPTPVEPAPVEPAPVEPAPVEQAPRLGGADGSPDGGLSLRKGDE